VPQTAELERVTAIVLRIMRTPVLVLITVSALTILGMVLMPGKDAEGNPANMSFFHALYFLSYTATTTGFGEIPYEFTDAQRLWAIIALFMSVVAWIYAIGSIIGLIQNPHFRQSLAQAKFSRTVRRVSEPFYIICGFGDTGSLLTRGLSDAGFIAVIIDSDPNRIQALSLRNYPVTMPGLCADAGVPPHLIAAGVRQSNCRAVIALTNNEGVNRKVVIIARLLNPDIQTICRSSSQVEEEFLSNLGSVTVVDPFDTFAAQLSTALNAPALHNLSEWLVGAYGVRLDEPVCPPVGNWILCGFGRMGKHLHEALQQCAIPTAVIDPTPSAGEKPMPGRIVGHTNPRTLRQAGIAHAVGIVAATNSDSNNLGILLNARALNPKIFLLVRQNRHEHEVAFQAAQADLIMQPSLVTARRILFLLVAPLVTPYLQHLQAVGDKLLRKSIRRLQEAIGDGTPHLWTETISERHTSVSSILRDAEFPVALADILRDPGDRERSLDCVPLTLKRPGSVVVMPEGEVPLRAGDRILMCGTRQARRVLDGTLNDKFALQYLVTGVEEPRGYIMQWLHRWRQQRQAAAP
jgi:Trk K+ transport system NAD-binding subunit